jgi:hypothetical protein
MNLYFLSLLKKDEERRKNLTCVYYIKQSDKCLEGYTPKLYYDLTQYCDYELGRRLGYRLKQRFPFLQVGDLIEKEENLLKKWNGSQVVLVDFPLPHLHPFFFSLVDEGDWEHNDLPRSVIHQLSISRLERRMKFMDENMGHFLVQNLKVGKTRYECIIMPYGLFYDEDMVDSDFYYLENKVKSKSIVMYRTTLRMKIYDYKSRYKKRLFIFY